MPACRKSDRPSAYRRAGDRAANGLAAIDWRHAPARRRQTPFDHSAPTPSRSHGRAWATCWPFCGAFITSTLSCVTDDDDGQDKTAAADGGQAGAKDQPAPPWRRWTIGVAAFLALLVSLLLLVGDGLAGVINNLGGGPPSAGTWLGVAAAGHGTLAVASAVLFGLGFANSARRQAAVLAAWAIIPVGIGWFLLCGRLASA